MTDWLLVSVLSVIVAVLLGWGVPEWTVSRLLPVLETSHRKVRNYRGSPVPTGLGVAWAVWGVGVTLVGGLVSIAAWIALRLTAGSPQGTPPWLRALTSSPLSAALALMPVLLVFGVLVFGMIDDTYGDGASRGFAGHLRELAKGRLTTGGLKMLGIGALAVWAAGSASVRTAQFSATAYSGAGQVLTSLAAWVCGALTIALAANLVNLTDLRPGRALKSFGVLALVGVCAAGWATWQVLAAEASSGVLGMSAAARVPWFIATVLCIIALVFGPAIAVARPDLREKAMLGDAGANAMGALGGYLIAANLPLAGVAVAAAVLLALNIASERVSFSRVIERSRVLSRLDALGRIGADGTLAGADREERRGAQTPGTDSVHEGKRKEGGS